MLKRRFITSEKIAYGFIIIILALIIVAGYQYITKESKTAIPETGNKQVTVIKSIDSSAILVVPNDAGVDVSKISIEKIEDSRIDNADRLSDIYKFGPSGTVFDNPIELRVKYFADEIGRCPDELNLYHYNDDGTLKGIIPSQYIYCNINMSVFDIDSFSEDHIGQGNERNECNAPSGPLPQVSDVNPKTGSRSDTFTITGTDLTSVVQFYMSSSKSTYVGKANKNCNQVSLPVPKDLPPGTYTLKIYRAKDKISNGKSVTITGAPTGGGDDGGGNCNSPSGPLPRISSVTPSQVNRGDRLTIRGNSLTRTVQFYSSSGRNTYAGNVNSGCDQTTINVPNELADGTYTVKIYRAKNKISNGETITIGGGSGGGGSVLGGGNCPANNIPISLPFGIWRPVDIAYSTKSDIALAVWNKNGQRGSIGPAAVGQFVKGDGTLVGSNIVLGTTPDFNGGIKIAYDEDDDLFLVVWGTAVGNAVGPMYGSLVKPDGTFVKQNFKLIDRCNVGAQGWSIGNSIEYSKSAKKFFVACTQGIITGGTIMGMFVSPDGTLGSELTISGSRTAGGGANPSVAAGPNNLLVTWGFDDGVHGRFIDNNGNFMAARCTISPTSRRGYVVFYNNQRNEYDVFYGWFGAVKKQTVGTDGTVGSETAVYANPNRIGFSDMAYSGSSYWVAGEHRGSDQGSDNGDSIYEIRSDGTINGPFVITQNSNAYNYVPAVTVVKNNNPLSLMNRNAVAYVQFGSLTNSGDCSGTSTYGITGTNVLRTWTPTQTNNGKNPQLSLDGRYVTYGFGENWVADLQTGEEKTFGTGNNGWWIANDKYTYIKEINNNQEAERYEVNIGEWVSNLVNDDKALVAGNLFVAADGHWASWLEDTGRIAYDNELLGTNLGGFIWISGNQIVHANGTNNEKVLIYTNKQNIAAYQSQVTVNQLTLNKGYIVYGGLGPMHGITPDGQDVDLTVAPWRIENYGQVFFVDNAPWVASATFDASKQKGYIMLRPWNQNDGILIEANVTFGLHVVYYNNTFVVAYSDNNGKLSVVWVSKNATIVNLVNELNQGSGSSGVFSIVQEKNILSSSLNLGSPNVAFDEQNKVYLVAYESSGELYGIFLDKDGSAIGQPFSIGSLAGTIFGVKVAWGGETFAVFYTVGTSGNDYAKANLVKYVPGQQPQISSDIVVDTLKGKRDKWRGTSVAYSPSTGYFLASWYNSNNANTYSNGHSYIRGIKLDETLTQTIQLTDRAPSFQNCLYATPHIAVDPSSGTAIVVGHRDPTNDDDCKNKPANWYRLIDTSTMIALGQTGYTASASAVPSQSVAFSGSINKFLIVWSKQVSGAGTISGQAVALDGQIDQDYTIKTADTSNSDRLDDNLGLYTVSYNKGSNKFLIAMRGDDTPQTNGEAPVYIMAMNGDGSPISNTFMKLSNQMNNQPSTDIAANPLDKQFLVVYRPKFKKFDSVLINS